MPFAARNQSAPSVINITKSSYNADKLYTDSTDAKGHYEQINVKVPPSVDALIMQAVDDNPGYNRSRQAFIRDAIVHRLHYVHMSQGSTIDPVVIEQMVFRAQMQSYLAMNEQVTQDATMFREVLAIGVELRDWSSVNQYIEQIQNQLETLTLSEGHRDILEQCVADGLRAMAAPPVGPIGSGRGVGPTQ